MSLHMPELKGTEMNVKNVALHFHYKNVLKNGYTSFWNETLQTLQHFST